MNKIKVFFIWLGKLIITPLKAIVTIPVSDRFIVFMNKHIWLRMVIAAGIAALILAIIHIWS